MALAMAAQAAVASEPDENQAQMRINPQISDSAANVAMDFSEFPFLNMQANIIDMNGEDWTPLKEKFAAAVRGDSLFSVLYLGDSHIQADFGGAVVREHLAARAGGAGRGFITPFKLAATNQPTDYTIRMTSEFIASRLLKMPWASEMTFSGISLQPLTDEFDIDISCRTPFDRLRIFYRGEKPRLRSLSTDGEALAFDTIPSAPGTLGIQLGEIVEDLTLSLSADNTCTIAGFDLAYASAGTFVHSIGNNGATYSTYGLVDHFGDEVASLGPDLIMIALGTNEAFSNIDRETMLGNIDQLVGTLRRHNPAAKIALITPTECMKRTYTRRRGRRRRVAGMAVNTKVAEIRNCVLDYARENNIPVYDSYAVFGGKGSAQKMKNKSILSKDGVHFTAPGYRLQGSLLAEALLKSLH